MFKFTMGEQTNVDQACGLVFKGKMYILGSEDEKKQIAVVDDCALKRVGDLPFRFMSGSCTNMYDEQIVMCFDAYAPETCRT